MKIGITTSKFFTCQTGITMKIIALSQFVMILNLLDKLILKASSMWLLGSMWLMADNFISILIFKRRDWQNH